MQVEGFLRGAALILRHTRVLSNILRGHIQNSKGDVVLEEMIPFILLDGVAISHPGDDWLGDAVARTFEVYGFPDHSEGIFDEI